MGAFIALSLYYAGGEAAPPPPPPILSDIHVVGPNVDVILPRIGTQNGRSFYEALFDGYHTVVWNDVAGSWQYYSDAGSSDSATENVMYPWQTTWSNGFTVTELPI